MVEKAVEVAIVLGVCLLAVVVATPLMIDSVTTDTDSRVAIQEGEFVDLTERLKVTAQTVREPQNEVTVRYRNEQTFERIDVTLNETDPPENKTVQLSGENITASLIEIDDNSTAIVETTHSPMFGWADGPRVFFENMPVVIAMIAFVLVLAVIKVVT